MGQQQAQVRRILAGAGHLAGHAAQHVPLHSLHLGFIGEEGAAQLEEHQLAALAVVHRANS